jgi:hypothetical protein
MGSCDNGTASLLQGAVVGPRKPWVYKNGVGLKSSQGRKHTGPWGLWEAFHHGWILERDMPKPRLEETKTPS